MTEPTRKAARYRAEETATLRAPAAAVYAAIADYHDRHKRIIPPKWFTALEVTRGGTGAGTEIIVGMKMMGRERRTRGVVSEPEPGVLLAERYPDDDILTTFEVRGAGDGACQVTIASDLPVKGGIVGWLERSMVVPLLRRIFRAELQRLEGVAREG